MKFVNAIIFFALAAGIWFISDSLTYYHLSKMEASGEIPYGPIPAVVSENYLFKKSSTILMDKYPVERIGDLTKDNFETIVLSSLSEQDQINLRPHLKKILTTSEEYQLDPFWMLSIVMVESRFINNASSAKNAHGLMQIQPETASHIYQMMNKNIDQEKLVKNLFNTDENLEIGAFYLKKLLQNFRMNFRNATIAYNVGPNKLKNLLAIKETHEEGDSYYQNVFKNYLKFAKHFKNELRSFPTEIDSTYVVLYHDTSLEELIIKNMGILAYIPSTSQNLASY